MQGLSALQDLALNHTQIADITPLQGLSKLRELTLSGTQVEDLRLIADHPFEFEASVFVQGLKFGNTPAAGSSAELTELSKIEGDRERTDKTLTYLRNLPPDPEPLPWETASAPKTDNLTRIAIAGGQIDVAHEPLDASDLTDLIKARLYERLSVGTATVLWTTETIAALEFIQVNKEVILTIATSWGAGVNLGS
ncbi:leucine-rich repeat domain-containing protein [Sulfitobacter sp.]|uniref:leucine-rich repeat domain-containing protein n=1 Tax=Sulfitobacter sp. TaxID=1903071 RepID=UPI0030038AA6